MKNAFIVLTAESLKVSISVRQIWRGGRNKLLDSCLGSRWVLIPDGISGCAETSFMLGPAFFSRARIRAHFVETRRSLP